MSGIAIPAAPLWSKDPTLIEVREGRLQLKSSLLNGLLGNWPMGEGSWNGTPGEVIDGSPNLNHGVAVGSPPTTIAGFNGTRRGNFDGTVDHIKISTLTGISGSIGTIFTWFNLDVDNNDFNWIYHLTPFASPTNTTQILAGVDFRAGDSQYRVVAYIDGVVQWDWQSANILSIGTNYSLEISQNGTSPVFYHNKVDITAAGSFNDSTDTTVWLDDLLAATTPIDTFIMGSSITSSATSGEFNGKIWGVSMWDRVLTAGERTALDNNGAGGFIEDVGPFSTASPASTSPWFAIDQNTLDAVTAILLQLILEGTATIKFQWALNGGAFNGSFLTPAQLLAALVSQSITDKDKSMRLMSQHNSNSTDQAAMLLPQTKVEASGITGDGGGSRSKFAGSLGVKGAFK